MTNETSRQYSIQDERQRAAIRTTLSEIYEIEDVGESQVHYCYLDTFDWQLYRKKSVVTVSTEGKVHRLSWQNLAGQCVHGSLPVSDMPKFADGLPESNLRERLQSATYPRALLPILRVKSRLRRYNLRNKDQKIVVRAFIEENEIAPNADSSKGDSIKDVRLRLANLKGYEEALNRIADRLAKIESLRPVPDLYIGAMEAFHLRPGEYSAKPKVSLRPDEPVDTAAKKILSKLFEVTLANEEGVLDDVDTEFLHDFRTSVRRARSLLSQLKGCVEREFLQYGTKEFSRLGRLTSQARDYDVVLLHLTDYFAELVEPSLSSFEFVRSVLSRRRNKEYVKLKRAIRSKGHKAFKKKWQQLLQEADASQSMTVERFATEKLRKVFQKVMRMGQAIDAKAKPERLHDLRKQCKKLRYLLEFFHSLFPTAKDAIAHLKRLQDNLGEFQDVRVHRELLMQVADELPDTKQKKRNTQVAMALGVIVENLSRRQEKAAGDFSHAFRAFSRASKGFEDIW